MKNETLMYEAKVEPGFLAMSHGDKTINAIIWGADGAFYFYPVTTTQAFLIEAWAKHGDEEDLRHALKDATEYDLDMFYAGQEIVD